MKRGVVAFAIEAEAGLRPDLLQEQAFAPSRMGDDRIGGETRLLHLQRRPEAGSPRMVLVSKSETQGCTPRVLPRLTS